MKKPSRGFWSRLKVYWAIERACRRNPYLRVGQTIDNTMCRYKDSVPNLLFVIENDVLAKVMDRGWDPEVEYN